jgi:hypothetical protein
MYSLIFLIVKNSQCSFQLFDLPAQRGLRHMNVVAPYFCIDRARRGYDLARTGLNRSSGRQL